MVGRCRHLTGHMRIHGEAIRNQSRWQGNCNSQDKNLQLLIPPLGNPSRDLLMTDIKFAGNETNGNAVLV
jgi:hypothetical protein